MKDFSSNSFFIRNPKSNNLFEMFSKSSFLFSELLNSTISLNKSLPILIREPENVLNMIY